MSIRTSRRSTILTKTAAVLCAESPDRTLSDRIIVYGATDKDEIAKGGTNGWAERKKLLLVERLKHSATKKAIFYDDTKKNILVAEKEPNIHAVLVNWEVCANKEVGDQVLVEFETAPHCAIRDHLNAYRNKHAVGLIAFDFDRTLVSCHTGGTPDVEEFLKNGTLHRSLAEDGEIYGGTASTEEMNGVGLFLLDLLQKEKNVIIVTRGIQSRVQEVIDRLIQRMRTVY